VPSKVDVRILADDGKLLVESNGILLQRADFFYHTTLCNASNCDGFYELRWDQTLRRIVTLPSCSVGRVAGPFYG